MAKYTEDQIANTAELSTFYVTPDGLWLRIEYCDMDEGYFQCIDESSFEEYRFNFAEIAEDEDPEFHQLTRAVIQ